jgi:hypothetical protein
MDRHLFGRLRPSDRSGVAQHCLPRPIRAGLCAHHDSLPLADDIGKGSELTAPIYPH